MDRNFRYVAFDGYVLDRVARLLIAPDASLHALRARWFDVLDYLILERDRVVPRDELLSRIWPRRIVEENNLTQAIAALRRLLGARAGSHRGILTVSGVGYRFVAPVEALIAPARQSPMACQFRNWGMSYPSFGLLQAVAPTDPVIAYPKEQHASRFPGP